MKRLLGVLAMVALTACGRAQENLDQTRDFVRQQPGYRLPPDVEYLGTVDGCSVYRLREGVYVAANTMRSANCAVSR